MDELLEKTTESEDESAQEMTSAPVCSSHLVVDIGSSYTVATLYDLVEGQFRFVARGSSLTTTVAPWRDVKYGFQVAVARIMEATGRKLLNAQGYLISPSRLDGSGVDCFGIMVSAAEPLRTVFISMMEDSSLLSARKAAQTIYSNQVDQICFNDARSIDERLESLLTQDMDLALIVGGSDGSVDRRLVDHVETLSIALGLLDDFRKPQVIYAANTELRKEITEILREDAGVIITNNVRPFVDFEDIDDLINILSTLHLKKHILTLPGLEGIKDPCKLPILPTAHAFGGIAEYLAALLKGKVVGLDIGSANTSLVISEPGIIDLIIRSDLGLGKPIVNVLKMDGLSDILSWTNGQVRFADVRDMIFNKSLVAHTIPQDPDELAVELGTASLITKAIAGELSARGLVSTRGKLEGIKMLILRGGALAKSPSTGYPLLAAIDGLQPVGVFQVLLDSNDVLPAMGLLAAHNPQLVVQVLDNEVLTNVGWVAAIDGPGELGQPVLSLSLELDGNDLIKRNVKYGELELIRIPKGRTGKLTLDPAPDVNVGAGPGKRSVSKITGGELGLIVDARGELSRVAGDDALRRKHQQQWLRVVAS